MQTRPLRALHARAPATPTRQLGHASITTTLNVYTHLFDHAEHAAPVIERLEDRFADLLRHADERSELHAL